MFVVSYVIIFAFHPEIDINRIIIERSFGHSRERLARLSYLTREQLDFKDNETLLQLRDCALAVAEKKSKIAISKMFSTKLKFASDCQLKWFNKKFKSNGLKLSNEEKRKYEIKHPIDWMQDRCCLCHFPLEINPTSFDVNENTMLYTDFIIFRKHKFLRNIFSSEELLKTDALKDLKTFHEKFVTFLRIAVFLQNAFKINEEFDECFGDNLLEFCGNNCADCSDFGEIKELISDVKIKNKSNTKVLKLFIRD